MKQKALHFAVGLVIYYIVGLIMLMVIDNSMPDRIVFAGIWATLMAFADLFIFDVIQKKFSRKPKKQIEG